MYAATKRRAFWALARTDASDLAREKLTWASMLTMALILLVIHTSMWLAFAVVGSAPTVAREDVRALPSAAMAEALARFVPGGSGDDAPNATLSAVANAGAAGAAEADAGGLSATVSLLEPGIGWDPLWQALRAAGVPAGSIDVVAPDGSTAPDFLRLNLGTAFLAVLASIALIGTTVPLVAARERGMLKLLGTTPLPRRLFLASRIPTRLALLLACTAAIVAIGIARRYTEVSALPRFVVTVSCAAVMLFGVGAVFAARARNAEASQNLMAGLSLALVFSAGGVLPTALLPDNARAVLGLLPGSWVTEPASADLAGTTPVLPVPVYWALMLASGIVCFVLAARRFSWDAAPTPAVQSDSPGHADTGIPSGTPSPSDTPPTTSPQGAIA